MQCSIVLPTFNERENLRKLVPLLLDLPSNINILIVDDNSPDGTGDLADRFASQYPGRLAVIHRYKERGLGSAYRQGLQQALEDGAEAIFQMDSDFSHPVDKVTTMIECLENADGVIGSRYIGGGSVDLNWPLWRKALSRWGNFYARTILRLPLRDVTGGFRLWRADVIRAIPWNRIRSNGYVFQIETIYVATRLGFQFTEIPIHFPDRTWGQSKLNWRIQLEAAWRVWWVLYNYRDLVSRATR